MQKEHYLRHVAFSEVELNDPFFDSLKADYPGFEKWFYKKVEEHSDVYVQYDENRYLQGFLYMKIEFDGVSDVNPPIISSRILKIGTFKINAHGTKMGEQFLKIIFEHATEQQVDCCYLTIFEKQEGLISLVKSFGFDYWGTKGDDNNAEMVLVKDMNRFTGKICYDYPKINIANSKKYLLSIYPKYHSIMFPEAILSTESRNIIKDISPSNSIHKVYVCSMGDVENIKYGDIIVMYRTAEYGRSAEYSAVATSVCTVEEVRLQTSFSDFEDFYRFACQYTIFDRDDLQYWYNRGGLKVIKMVYNFALKKRIVRHELIEKLGLDRNRYWGFFELTDLEFKQIVYYGQAEDYIC